MPERDLYLGPMVRKVQGNRLRLRFENHRDLLAIPRAVDAIAAPHADRHYGVIPPDRAIELQAEFQAVPRCSDDLGAPADRAAGDHACLRLAHRFQRDPLLAHEASARSMSGPGRASLTGSAAGSGWCGSMRRCTAPAISPSLGGTLLA